MSTGLNCEFVRLVTTNEWYYLLENGSAPRNAFNWRDYATAYGPFTSYEEADEHLRRNHANPGGASIDREADPRRDATLARLIQNATHPHTRPTWLH